MTATADGARTGVRLELEDRDPGTFFVAVTSELDGTLVGRWLVPRSADELLEYFEIRGMDADAAAEIGRSLPDVTAVRVIERGAEPPLAEVVVRGECVGRSLADERAVIRAASARAGVTHIVVDVPPHADATRVCETLVERHPDVDLVSKHQHDASPLAQPDPMATLFDRLTERQREALTVAVAGGYYAWPRRSSAEACAAAMGVSQPTFSQHLRRAERTILGGVVDAATRADEPTADDPPVPSPSPAVTDE